MTIHRFLPLLTATGLLFLLSLAPARSQPAHITGPELAAQLRALRPSENSRYSCQLQVKRHRKKPVRFQATTEILLTNDSWQTIYRAQTHYLNHHLTVIHHPSNPNQYFYSETPNTDPRPATPQPVPPAKISLPFAASDFWLSDLAQEHFHWPHQHILKSEMRISRSCKVLESKPAPDSNHPYGRVLSWIDNETGALVIAEAYDQSGKLLKEFAVKRVEKVDGRYQPQEIEIENVQTRSRTRLIFEFD